MWLCNVGKCKPQALRQVFHGFFMGFSMFFHGFNQQNGPCLTNSSFKLRLDSNASASGLLTLAVFVQRMWRPRHLHSLHTLHTRGQRASAARRGAISPGGPILRRLRLAHVSTDISESQTFCQFLSDISVGSLLFQFQIS